MMRLAILLATALLLCPLPVGAARADEWQTSSPEEQGMDSAALARLVESGGPRGMDSFLLVRHGKIVTEAYYAPFRAGLKHRVNSVTKSVVGSLVGIALSEGKLQSPGQPMLDFFAGRPIANLDDRKKAITLQDLLDMESGIEWVEPFSGRPESLFAMERSRDWQQFILDRPMAATPGSLFDYNSGNPHLLSAILSKVTGGSALDYAREKLFGPLGIEDVRWRSDPQGISTGGFGLYLLPRDMARIGALYLRGGAWGADRILPAAWIDKVRHATVDMHQSWAPNLRYANLFWVMPDKGVFMAVGFHRQLIVVMPALDIVAVTTASSRLSGPAHVWTSPRFGLAALLDDIAAAVKSDSALPANPAALADLAGRIRDAATEKPTPAGEASALAKAISGKVYRFKDNALRVNSFSLTLTGADPSYQYEARAEPGAPVERYGGPIGLDGLYKEGGRRLFGPSAAKGAWLDDRTFVLDLQTLGNDDAARVTLAFEGKTVDATFDSEFLHLKLQGEADD